MSKSTKANVNQQLARESHQLQEQKIEKIIAAMKVLVYGAANVTISKQRHVQVCLNTP
jgi:hypothetical protein